MNKKVLIAGAVAILSSATSAFAVTDSDDKAGFLVLVNGGYFSNYPFASKISGAVSKTPSGTAIRELTAKVLEDEFGNYGSSFAGDIAVMYEAAEHIYAGVKAGYIHGGETTFAAGTEIATAGGKLRIQSIVLEAAGRGEFMFSEMFGATMQVGVGAIFNKSVIDTDFTYVTSGATSAAETAVKFKQADNKDFTTSLTASGAIGFVCKPTAEISVGLSYEFRYLNSKTAVSAATTTDAGNGNLTTSFGHSVSLGLGYAF